MLKLKNNNDDGGGAQGVQDRTAQRGFASMDPEKAAAARSKGGKTVSKNRQHMAEIGKKGGQHSHKTRQ